MLILIDNGHGIDTLGKCSPDRSLREYAYAREIAQRLSRKLALAGYEAQLLTPEESDISISARVRRANAWCAKRGARNVLLVSIHCNAAGNGRDWAKARGWLSIVDDSASATARRFADLLFDAVEARGLKTRRYTPGCKYWLYGQTQGRSGVRLGLLKNTACPAVLTENFFQDNREDVAFLLSEEGKSAVTDIHFDAIVQLIKEQRA